MKHHAQLVRGQCKQLMHVVKADVRDHPSDYSSERMEQVSMAMQELEERGEPVFHLCLSSLALYILPSFSQVDRNVRKRERERERERERGSYIPCISLALLQFHESVAIATESLSSGEHLSQVDMRSLVQDSNKVGNTYTRDETRHGGGRLLYCE